MEATALLPVGAFASAFVGGWLVSRCLFERWHRSRLRAASQDVGAAEGAAVARWLRNGFSPFLPLADALLRIPQVEGFAREGVKALEGKGRFSSERALCSLLLAACLATFLVGSILAWSVLGGLACVGVVLVVVLTRLRSGKDERNDAIREAVPDALQSMGACSQSGLSLVQTMQQVATETPTGLREMFERSAHVLQTGGTSSEALSCLQGGTDVPELAFVAVALDVQHQTGGSMKQVLEAARDMVESELDLRRSLKVQTAQARLSARVVTVMPFIMIALLSLFSQDYLAPFFQSVAGLCVLGVALGMQLTGVLLVRRMLKVGD